MNCDGRRSQQLRVQGLNHNKTKGKWRHIFGTNKLRREGSGQRGQSLLSAQVKRRKNVGVHPCECSRGALVSWRLVTVRTAANKKGTNSERKTKKREGMQKEDSGGSGTTENTEAED